MMEKVKLRKNPGLLEQPVDRLSFLKYSGAAMATAGLFIAGCKAEMQPSPAMQDNGAGARLGNNGHEVQLGGGDLSVLKYAYALEQLEAAFYTRVVGSLYMGITTAEAAMLNDIHKHEVIHREFLKAALGTEAIRDLTFNFSSIDFTSRSSVLGTAKAFEDLGVSAYNGAGQLLKDPGYLLLAGKIVSVEARHAAAIRDTLNVNSADFAGDDVVDPLTGFDMARTPAQVLAIAGTYIVDVINANNLPKNKK